MHESQLKERNIFERIPCNYLQKTPKIYKGEKSKQIKQLQPLNELKLKENCLLWLGIKYMSVK